MIQSSQFDILEAQRITEKTSRCSAHNQYVFKVRKDATKTLIKRLISETYGVKVKACNIVNRRGKFKARRNGSTKAFKIAYVTLESGQELNLTSQES
ncbi:uL23 family ribosomal protein [Candidatus Synchoanobacter obligatus]|uniref:Large ribosomal subunit protein uL23 n=1 Tax=Candidatus Synchoanobacter obligatus TaxID=2919597 RepID=A0ABT1L6J7_9GAMM|nr:50S ribosomal protein L23 [Candidatus Synchoanobacter obligatus]MCP8352488.1 50S ribosomal protein L23 [Candidatus Synchoanobacter obligatus]